MKCCCEYEKRGTRCKACERGKHARCADVIAGLYEHYKSGTGESEKR